MCIRDSSITESSLCDCSYCRNYRLQIKSAVLNVAIYLDSWGIDIEKPLETSPLEPDENGMLEYCCCQYIVLGNCEPEYHHKIAKMCIRDRACSAFPRTAYTPSSPAAGFSRHIPDNISYHHPFPFNRPKPLLAQHTIIILHTARSYNFFTRIRNDRFRMPCYNESRKSFAIRLTRRWQG